MGLPVATACIRALEPRTVQEAPVFSLFANGTLRA